MKLSVKNTAKHSLPSGVLGWDVAPAGDCAVAAAMDGVYRVDLTSGASERIGAHKSYVSGVVYLSDDRIVTAGYDGVLAWRNSRDGKVLSETHAHQFWSWDLAVSPDKSLVASATGQYIAGGYEYEPAAETEPSVKLFRAADGSLAHSLSMLPSIQAVAFSPDGQFVAAGNLMGDVHIWETATGNLAAKWRTDAFTSWGIIKSHCYIGGIHAIAFTNDDQHLLAAGMGPMRDPMAGNGRQLWQKFAWRQSPPKMVAETNRNDSGEGLMETLAVHPGGEIFVMAGRLRGGKWSTAFFETSTGKILHSLRTDFRVTEAKFFAQGKKLILAGLVSQPTNKDPFGRYHIFDVELS